MIYTVFHDKNVEKNKNHTREVYSADCFDISGLSRLKICPAPTGDENPDTFPRY
jgi:hypothetical protein